MGSKNRERRCTGTPRGPGGRADLPAVLDEVDVGLVLWSGSEHAEDEVAGFLERTSSAALCRPGALTRSTCRSMGISGSPNENRSSTDAVFLPMPSIGSASRAPRVRTCRRGTRGSSRRVPRGCAAASPGSEAPSGWPARPARSFDQFGERRVSTAAQSGATPSGSPIAAPSGARVVGLDLAAPRVRLRGAPRTRPRRWYRRCSGSGSSGSARWSGRGGAATSDDRSARPGPDHERPARVETAPAVSPRSAPESENLRFFGRGRGLERARASVTRSVSTS